MRVERFGGYDVWEWLTITNHDESILFWHLCQRWNQKTILKSQSFTNGKNNTNIICTGSDYNFAKSEMDTFCIKFEISYQYLIVMELQNSWNCEISIK